MRLPRNLRSVPSFLLALLLAPTATAGDGVWTTTFPFGADIRPGGLAVSPVDPQTLYALPELRGVYRSDDAAAFWRGTTDAQAPPFDPTDAVWVAPGAAAGTAYVVALSLEGELRRSVFRSADGGRSWTSVGDDLGRPVTALAVDHAAPDRLLVGLAGGDVFESLDAGTNWRRLGSPGFTPRFLRLVVDPADADTLYASLVPRGLFRSRDGGATWARFAEDAGMAGVVDLLVDPSSPADLYAVDFDPALEGCGCAGRERLFHSADGGATWTRFDLDCDTCWAFGDPGRRLAVAAGDPASVFALVGTHLWLSSDGGSSWERRLIGGDAVVRAVVAAPGDAPAAVYAGTAAGVYRSDDGGDTWSFTSTGLRGRPRPGSPHQLAFDRSAARVIYSGAGHGGPRTGGGFRSADGGASWEPMRLPDGDAESFGTHPAAPGLVYGAHNGVSRSRDFGRTWEPLFAAPGGFQMGDFRLDPFDPQILYFAGYHYPPAPAGEPDEGIYRSADGGATWDHVFGAARGRGAVLAIDPLRPGVLYAGAVRPDRPLMLADGRFEVLAQWRTSGGDAGYGEPVRLTDDAGYFWFFGDDNVELVVKVLDGCPVNGHYWVFAAGLTNVEVVLRVTDRWTGSSRDYPNPQGRPFAPVQDTTALTGCDAVAAGEDLPVNGFYPPRSDLYRSRDGGSTWAPLRVGSALQGPVLQVVVHPLDSDVVLVAADSLYRTTDGGETWRVVGDLRATAVAVDPTDPQVIYAGSRDGFYRSVDGGEMFDPFDAGLPRPPGILALAVDPLDARHVLAATTSGVWEIQLPAPGPED